MEFKGTKGEWEVDDVNKAQIMCRGYKIAQIIPNNYYKANAQLIAAAPELLKALQRVDKAIDDMKLNDRFGHTQMYVKEAINKALGQ